MPQEKPTSHTASAQNAHKHNAAAERMEKKNSGHAPQALLNEITEMMEIIRNDPKIHPLIEAEKHAYFARQTAMAKAMHNGTDMQHAPFHIPRGVKPTKELRRLIAKEIQANRELVKAEDKILDKSGLEIPAEVFYKRGEHYNQDKAMPIVNRDNIMHERNLIKEFLINEIHDETIGIDPKNGLPSHKTSTSARTKGKG